MKGTKREMLDIDSLDPEKHDTLMDMMYMGFVIADVAKELKIPYEKMRLMIKKDPEIANNFRNNGIDSKRKKAIRPRPI